MGKGNLQIVCFSFVSETLCMIFLQGKYHFAQYLP